LNSRQNSTPTTSIHEFYNRTFLQTSTSSENKSNHFFKSPNLHLRDVENGSVENPQFMHMPQRRSSLERQVSVNESQQKLSEFTQSFNKILDSNVSCVISLQKDCLHMLESMQNMKEKLASFEDEMKTILSYVTTLSPSFQNKASVPRCQHDDLVVSSDHVFEPSRHLIEQQSSVHSISKSSSNHHHDRQPNSDSSGELENNVFNATTTEDAQQKLDYQHSKESSDDSTLSDLSTKSTTPRKSLVHSVLSSMSLASKRKIQSPSRTDESPARKKTLPNDTNHKPERCSPLNLIEFRKDVSSDERPSSSDTENEAHPMSNNKIQQTVPSTSSSSTASVPFYGACNIKQEPVNHSSVASALNGEQHEEVNITSSIQSTASDSDLNASSKQQNIRNLCAYDQSTSDDDETSSG